MAAIKFEKFLGIAPKISDEHLPPGSGQVAHNLKLYSGDLIPYRDSSLYGSTASIGEIQTLYALRDTDGVTPIFLSWMTDVDIITVSDSSDDEQRFYYTGDGVPKVSTVDLATAGSAPYPATGGYYELGLPLPTVEPVATASPAVAIRSTSIERDSGNTAVFTTTTSHGLRTGQTVTVSGFTGTPTEEFNVVNTRITVTSDTTFEYFNAGDAIASATNANGVVDVAGATVTRDYTYTWYTPWNEESIGADPSDTLFIKEGQNVTITGLPTSAPSGDNFITAMRVYRTLSSPSGTEFFLLTTLYWPQTTARVELTSNVATVTMAIAHSFIAGDRFKLTGCTDTTFNITDGVVLAVPTTKSFTYALVAGDIADKAETTGNLLHDASELPTIDDPVYWGDNTITTASYARTAAATIASSLFERTSDVATITTGVSHGFITGMVINITGFTGAVPETFNATDAYITVTGATTFTYSSAAADAGSTADTNGVIGGSDRAIIVTAAAHQLQNNTIMSITGFTAGAAAWNTSNTKITVIDSTTFMYTNTGGITATTADTNGVITNYSFVDDFDFLNLTDLLITDDYDPPDPTMQGITLAQNNLIAGFFGNQLAFSEIAKPWAWPIDFRQTFEYDIVAIEAVAGVLLVLTDEFAYRVSGNDPRTLSIARIDNPYPCLSKRSVVNMGTGAVFASHAGLVSWSPTTGMQVITQFVYDWDIWDVDVDPDTIVGKFYNDKYFGSHSGGAFIFEKNEKVGGFFITLGDSYTAAWLDPITDNFYYIRDETGDIYQWDDPTQPAIAAEWRSKVVVTKDYINVGAARVIGDFTTSASEAAAIAAFNAAVPATNAAVWALSQELGTLNGPTDYLVGAVRISNRGDINSGRFIAPGNGTINGDKLMSSLLSVGGTGLTTFNLYVDKELVATRSVATNAIFRLPAGYKSDTFSVSVSGKARIRAIHLGETPDGLRKA